MFAGTAAEDEGEADFVGLLGQKLLSRDEVGKVDQRQSSRKVLMGR